MVDITINMPAHVKEPDANGRLFSKKALKQAIKNFKGIPIIDRSCMDMKSDLYNSYSIPNITAIGIMNKAKYKKRKDVIKLQGELLNAELNLISDAPIGEISFADLSLFPIERQEAE